jgi:hypothetical protein
VITVGRYRLTKRTKKCHPVDCLGEIEQKYCMYCSQDCPSASFCVLIAMSHHILEDHTVPQSRHKFVPYFRL